MREQDEQQRNPLQTENIWKLIRKYSLPAIISGLINSLYNIVDQIFIGQSMGTVGNAATNVAFPLVTVLTSLSMLIGVGGASNFSLLLGKKSKEKARKIVGNSIVLALICGISLCIIVSAFLAQLMYLFGARGEVLAYSIQYARITAFGMPFAMIGSSCGQLIRADGSPKYAMISSLSGAVLNTILDPICIFVLHLGIRGAALATVTGQMITAVLVLMYFRKFRSLKLQKGDFFIEKTALKRICSLGMAAGFNQLAITIVQIVLNNSLGYYGELSVYGRDIPLACVGIISKVNTIYIAASFGIAQSCQPIMGYNYGAGHYGRVRQAYRCAATVIVTIGSVAFLCFHLFPRQIIAIFGKGNELYYDFSVRYFNIFLFFVFINGIQILTSSYFSSIGKAARGIFVSLSRQVLLFLPLILILPLFWGIEGILYAAPIADGIAFILAVILYLSQSRTMRETV